MPATNLGQKQNNRGHGMLLQMGTVFCNIKTFS